jgi:prevent-host-death family protein
MNKAAAADVKPRFASFLDQSSKGPVVITRDGNPIAVLMGVHDEDELDRLIFASSRQLHEILEAGRKEVREGRGIPKEEFWKQVDAEQVVPSKKKRSSAKKKKTSPA